MLDAAFRDRAVYLRAADALVVADLHVGRAEASDVTVPLDEAGDLRGRLAALLDRFDPAEAVFAGDVLHAFDRASAAAERSLRDLGDACREAGARPVVLRGNHDTMLEGAWSGAVRDAYELRPADDAGDGGDATRGPVVVRHGHEAPPDDEDAGLYVVGHDHPAIDVEGRRRPCYLYAEAAYRGADVLMLPAFTRLAGGAEVNGMTARDFRSPFVADADAFRPLVRAEEDDETLTFPPLGAFRRLL
ncbi:metallophosphoesterase [Candidatus Halobonum tyrrellensis]|uniref:Phosphoesterase, icc n=1 Tax=Candidatus Halobonum tyrrellensis G22 TaxID=1324957 RepID=V4GW05_9EURY|nr:metallophosphoesterase [Candidatus Halobonum tyrrellensis]ESP89311.1 phosphoesterase, icc [Candidatus Halobonum tyrrellensis G22]